ncbi:peptide-methionine (S)-S-oxide reductase MsrA [Sphingorhabdus sp.]|uniref:peptide-methionine (S)-S-oxide reductase MsrA n=1 Tax=Sphingorhabdus sp. TaxID=1902408 RepID=UPI00391CF8DF
MAAGCGSEIGAPVGSAHATEGIRIAAPAKAIVEPKAQQVAVFAGGCFWGVEAVFERVKGVTRVEPGYSGDTKATADYDLVSAGRTKHAESVRVFYNPALVSYNDLLHIFFSVAHDPTQINRQGPDRGAQYRTAIFPVNDGQRVAAQAYIAQLDKAAYWKKPIVTTIEPLSFFPAESYHQDFMAKNPQHPYILQWDKPKIANLNRLFANRVR